MSVDTETLDKLYLEWSQFTTAQTAKEINLERQLDAARKEIDELKRTIDELNGYED